LLRDLVSPRCKPAWLSLLFNSDTLTDQQGDYPMTNAIDTMNALIVELQDYCTANSLPLMSADELAAEDVTPEQRKWLLAYCERWATMAEREYAERTPQTKG
jgi:hypothetical protein